MKKWEQVIVDAFGVPEDEESTRTAADSGTSGKDREDPAPDHRKRNWWIAACVAVVIVVLIPVFFFLF